MSNYNRALKQTLLYPNVLSPLIGRQKDDVIVDQSEEQNYSERGVATETIQMNDFVHNFEKFVWWPRLGKKIMT